LNKVKKPNTPSFGGSRGKIITETEVEIEENVYVHKSNRKFSFSAEGTGLEEC